MDHTAAIDEKKRANRELRHRRYRRLGSPPGLLLSALTMAFSVLFAILPSDRQVVTYQWGADQTMSQPLFLSARTPDLLHLEIFCHQLACSQKEQILFQTARSETDGKLMLWTDEGKLYAQIVNSSSPDDLVAHVDLSDYKADVTYQFGALRIRSGEAEAVVIGDIIVSGFHWTADGYTANMELTTAPKNAVRNSRPQIYTFILGLVTFIVAQIVFVRETKSKTQKKSRLLRPSMPTRQTTFVALMTSITALAAQPQWDDGWLLIRSRQYRDQGFFGPHSDPLLPDLGPTMSPWHEWLFGVTLGNASSVIVLRALPIVFAILSWTLIQQYVLPVLTPAGEQTRTRWLAAVTHAVFVVAWFATLRPEPWLYLGIACVAALVATAEKRDSLRTALLIGLVSAPLVVTHPLALSVPLAGAPWLWSVRETLLRRPATALSAAFSVIAFAFFLFFLGGNLETRAVNRAHYRRLRPYLDESDYSFGFDALRTYFATSLSSQGTAIAWSLVLFALGVFGLIWTFVITPRDAFRTPQFLVLTGLLSSSSAFLLQPSRWIWHLAILGPITIVGLILLVSRLAENRPQSRALTFVGLLVLAEAVASLMRAAGSVRGRMPGLALRRVSSDFWSNRSSLVFGPDNQAIVWLVAIFVLYLVLVYFRAARRNSATQSQDVSSKSPFGLIVGILSLLIINVQLIPQVVDTFATAPEWTFGRQAALGITKSEARCGILGSDRTRLLFSEASWSNDATEPRFAIHGRTALVSPCEEFVGQTHGALQVPDFTLGTANHHFYGIFQQELHLDKVECADFPKDRAGNHACLYRVVNSDGTQLVNLLPSRVVWVSTRESVATLSLD
jgi:hypothetical protein